MPRLTLATLIYAPIDHCFDLCRDLDVHNKTVAHTKERLVGAKRGGLAELGDVLTFEAVHLGVRQRLTSRITRLERPWVFADEMVSGAFARFEDGTLMRDALTWTSPLGPLGVVADALVLKRYMQRFLVVRNRNLKALAEG